MAYGQEGGISFLQSTEEIIQQAVATLTLMVTNFWGCGKRVQYAQLIRNTGEPPGKLSWEDGSENKDYSEEQSIKTPCLKLSLSLAPER